MTLLRFAADLLGVELFHLLRLGPIDASISHFTVIHADAASLTDESRVGQGLVNVDAASMSRRRCKRARGLFDEAILTTFAVASLDTPPLLWA